MKIALYPGSFDPLTYGHLDIIRRSSRIFDHVIVAVSNNPRKVPSFTIEERIDMINKVCKKENIQNYEADSFSGLLIDYASERHVDVIVRGLRAVSDFEYEFQMSLTNHKLRPNIETVFLTTLERNLYISSSMVKEIAYHGGSIKSFVPEILINEIMERLQKK